MPKDELKQVNLLVKNVTYFNQIKSNNQDDADILMDLTYYPSSLRGENECVVDKEHPTSDDDIIFKFENGEIIRISGETIQVSIVL